MRVASTPSVNRVMLITQVFHPDEQATSQLFSELLAGLAANGMSVSALTGFPSGGSAWRQIARHETWRGVSISRGGLRIDGKCSLFARISGYGSYSLWLLWRLLVITPRDARLLVSTNPPFAPVVVWLCARLRGFSFDLILHDIYPDGLVAVGKLKPASIVARAWHSMNRRAFAAARQIHVLGRDMEDLCVRRYQVDSRKVIYSPNWSPIEITKATPLPLCRLRQELRLGEQFIVQYSGNMGLWHDIETIVRAATLLRHDKHIVFLMIGQGRRRDAAERISRELALPNITWLPFRHKDELHDSLACCHVALISQRAGLEGVAVPSKLYGIMASGRAVLAQVPAQSETALVVSEEDCGLVIPPGDAQALADAIRALAANRPRTAALGINAFAAYRRKYTVSAAIGRFINAMDSR